VDLYVDASGISCLIGFKTRQAVTKDIIAITGDAIAVAQATNAPASATLPMTRQPHAFRTIFSRSNVSACRQVFAHLLGSAANC